MRKCVLAGFAVLAAAIAVGCGEEGGETTVIRETADDGAVQAAAQAEAKVEELEKKLEQAEREDSASSAETASDVVKPEPEPEPVSEAPNVVGQRLDIAKSTLKSAGFKARVSGGGIFGVLVDRNWVVCDQLPPTNSKVDLNVDRSC